MLAHLDLTFVDLSKAIHWPKAIAKMPSVTELHLGFTRLSLIIPTTSISYINSSTSSLAVLDLSFNAFTSSMYPWLFNFNTSLVYLDLTYNWHIICEDLDWISHLPLLTHLDLTGVNLSKAIHWPQAINKMPSLTELYLSDTQLPWSTIPTISISHINSSDSLAVLDLSFNGLTFSIYPWLFNFSSCLVHLDLSSNDLVGSIPDSLVSMVCLESLILRGNGKLTGENLGLLSHLPSLKQLDLSYVNLSKAIHWPQAISEMPSLTELYLSGSQLPWIISTISISHINSSDSLAVLDLSSNGLTFSIYPWLFNLFSNSSLVHLELSHNDLNGSIPDAFGNISTLAYFDLSNNDLNGSIPDALGNMTALAHLDLSWNQLEGEILKSLRVLCNLQTSRLSQGNLIERSGKDFLSCSNDKLEDLYLSGNQFRGSFPDLSGFSQLRELNLGFNQLNGTLPGSIGQLPQLEVLSIPSNSLQGTVSANHFFGLFKLKHLDLSLNSLTFNITVDQVPQFQADAIMLASCKIGPSFPQWLQTQQVLTKLDISASGISDVIPNWFWNFASNLIWLNMSHNHISGTFPTSYSYHDLGMDMSSNCLEGSIPQYVFNAQWLDLSNNIFSGSISLSCKITNRSSLSHLDLSSNRLSGEPPQCWEQWTNLVVLNLANNNFSGKIKSSIGLLHHMQTLHLRNNSFIGALPSSLRNCRDLRLLDVGTNKLLGRIPTWIGGSLSLLIVFNLRSNEFIGSIPLNLCQLKKIQMLDFSGNNLSGKIPKCLKNLTAMAQKRSLVITYHEVVFSTNIQPSYVDNTWVQWKGKDREFKKTLGLVKSIDFSSNKLSGEIPMEVTDLVGLVSLNLSRNNLIGPIPTTIGQLKLLDVLDLSQNQLNGRIPDSLAQIADLSVLDLSYNTLSGKIPLGTQLQSFNAIVYVGNPGLCGPPLLKKCPQDESREVSFTNLGSKKEDIQDDENNMGFYGSIVLGFIIGFWGVCGTLLLNSSWRYAYFRFLSKVKDWFYVTTIVSMNKIRRSLQR